MCATPARVIGSAGCGAHTLAGSGRLTGSFGERIDPFSGEERSIAAWTFSSDYGTAIIAPADGIVRSSPLNGQCARQKIRYLP